MTCRPSEARLARRRPVRSGLERFGWECAVEVYIRLNVVFLEVKSEIGRQRRLP
jgi:hypothetical protein